MIIQLIDVASKQNAMPRKVCKQQCKVLARNKKSTSVADCDACAVFVVITQNERLDA